MVATFLASTPLLSESWRLCSLANTRAPMSFVTDLIGDVVYVAFSGIQIGGGGPSSTLSEPSCRGLVELQSSVGIDGLFSPLLSSLNEGEEAVMVHGELLSLFLSVFGCQTFRDQVSGVLKNSKSIVFTGHSLGGTIASLSALWLLSYLHSTPSSTSVLCLTFGSPLLGNESLSRAILRLRWGGNFCHVVSKHDLMPRLLFAPLAPITSQLEFLLQHWRLSMASSSSSTPQVIGKPVLQLTDEMKAQFFGYVMACLEVSSQLAVEEARMDVFWPFGNYLFCSEEGGICLENAVSVNKMMHLMLVSGSDLDKCVDDHLRYGDYIGNFSSQFLKKRSFIHGGSVPCSSYETGVALALQSSGINYQESVSIPAKECLKMARRLGRTPSLNAANMAISLSKITPYRAEIEWYKKSCDESDDQMGYYDSFKQSGPSRRAHKVNMNRHKLACFWNNLIDMFENNHLPYDFHKRAKWVNASLFYKLLVEPLDIAEYYRSGMHKIKGHYLNHGRERRYQIFDKWWSERPSKGEENTKRSKFAGLTQDSLFWAKLEEARECLANVRSENDAKKLEWLWNNINDFERYASVLVEKKEVSEDVLAKNSSYTLWVEELRELKSQMQQIRPRFPTFADGKIFP
ncbi:hypothetical protein FNV43_RR17552 [Rhamnella rubrinervis]|uniref:Lipase-like PAD4 n=1 Tax=Rhamnella rubrinervis TaxID=2594499 RepID=A0A8K0E2T3_9ROSA|nr:hypothetical protein FNV43_RR17552 [Rhamnella rubrinervis]